MANWCDLPLELLDLIAQNFDMPSDTLHFRSVCGSWRWAIPGPQSHSIQLTIASMKFQRSDDLQNCNFRLARRTFFHLSGGPLGGWLIKTEEHKPGVFHLFNPFSTTCIKINNHQSSNSNLTLLDINNVQIRELGHEYVLRSTCDHADIHDSFNMEHEKVAFKLLPSSSKNNYVILATHNTGKLLFYRSSSECNNLGEWAFLDDLTLGYDECSIFVNDWSLHYVDVVEYHGTFYAVTNSGRTVAINYNVNEEADYQELSSCVTVKLLTKSMIGGDKKCLVKSSDDLLMVDLYTCPTPSGVVNVHAVEIFKLNNEEQRWVLVKGLEGRALFLSNHSSFSVLAGLPGCKGNSIYFHLKNNWDYSKEDLMRKDNSEDDVNARKLQSDEIGVFDYDKGIIGSLPEYLQESLLFSWPPPGWVPLAT